MSSLLGARVTLPLGVRAGTLVMRKNVPVLCLAQRHLQCGTVKSGKMVGVKWCLNQKGWFIKERIVSRTESNNFTYK